MGGVRVSEDAVVTVGENDVCPSSHLMQAFVNVHRFFHSELGNRTKHKIDSFGLLYRITGVRYGGHEQA